MDNSNHEHIPVLLTAVLMGLKITQGEKYIDATIGDAGHAIAIVKKGGLLLGIDRDPNQVERAKRRLELACPATFSEKPDSHRRNQGTPAQQPIVCQGNFAEIKSIAQKNNFLKPKGILFDLGVSSYQLKFPEKGLSFYQDTPLDMRLSPEIKRSAKDIVNQESQEVLYEIFTRNAQEELARRISQAIVSSRNVKAIETTAELAQIVAAVKKVKNKSKLHPATKVFLALRIEVNDEINNLKKGLKQAIELLEHRGRVAVISFQESEDRVVKRMFINSTNSGETYILAKKPITPSETEMKINPRSRSAKLRIAEKL